MPSYLSSILALFRRSEQGSLWWHRKKDAGYQALVMSPGLFLVRWLCWCQLCLFAHSRSRGWLASSSCPTLASSQDWLTALCHLMYVWWESSGSCVLASCICWPVCHGHLPCLQPFSVPFVVVFPHPGIPILSMFVAVLTFLIQFLALVAEEFSWLCALSVGSASSFPSSGSPFTAVTNKSSWFPSKSFKAEPHYIQFSSDGCKKSTGDVSW